VEAEFSIEPQLDFLIQIKKMSNRVWCLPKNQPIDYIRILMNTRLAARFDGFGTNSAEKFFP
jgi:hypothetical protein